MVMLAAVALLGGVFILAGKGLTGDPDGKASASGSGGTSSASPQPSVRPTASPHVVTVESRPLPPASTSAPYFNGWIRPRADLPIMSSPDTGSAKIGVLKKGALAFAYSTDPQTDGVSGGNPSTWLQVGTSGGGQGFVNTAKGSTKLVDRYESMATPMTPYVGGIVVSPDRFIAYGHRPVETGLWPSILVVSDDGASWRIVDTGLPSQLSIEQVAYGPAGWLALASVEDPSGEAGTWLLASADGLEWQVSGSLDLPTNGFPAGLSAGPLGYVLSVDLGDRSSRPMQIFQSTDGVTWTGHQVQPDPELITGVLGSPLSIVATAAGYYAYTGAAGWQRDEHAANFGGYSSDGLTWNWQLLPEGGTNLRVAALGSGLVGIDVNLVTGKPRVWSGTMSGSAVTWKPDHAAALLLRNAAISSLASTGSRAVAFGWDTRTDEPVAFSSEPGGWTTVSLPSNAFEGVAVTLTAGRADGTFVALGFHHDLFADRPVLWSGTPSGSWAGERDPAMATSGPAVTRASCPARPPGDGLSFALLPAQWAVFCFGHEPFTFRAWAADCEGSFGVDPSVDQQPAWLFNSPNRLPLSPVEGNDSINTATPAQTLRVAREWTGHWLELTGHYDDPASTTCREQVDPRSGAIQMPRQLAIYSCRQQFVVTKVRVVDGPGA
jgi:hypothetical protein